MGTAEDEADDHVSEYGTGVDRQQAANQEADDRETARLQLSGPILRDMAIEQHTLALEAATRAGEMDAWTDTWVSKIPGGQPLLPQFAIKTRRRQAEEFREQSAIHRRRASALEDGARALGAVIPDFD